MKVMEEQLCILLLLLGVSQSQKSEGSWCKVALTRCLSTLPLQNPGGLPVSPEQIHSLCKAFKKGNECVDSWSKECLPKETQLNLQHQREGVMLLMALLCEDRNFKGEYLNHTSCYKSVSSDWDRCMQVFQFTVMEAAASKLLDQKQVDMCCARYGFNRCISMASRAKCDRSAAVMLRRISETLSTDSVRPYNCRTMDTAVCRGSDQRAELITVLIVIMTLMVVI